MSERLRSLDHLDMAVRLHDAARRDTLTVLALRADPSNPYAHAFAGCCEIELSEALARFIVADRMAKLDSHAPVRDPSISLHLNMAKAMLRISSGQMQAVEGLFDRCAPPGREAVRVEMAVAAGTGDRARLERAIAAAPDSLERRWFDIMAQAMAGRAIGSIPSAGDLLECVPSRFPYAGAINMAFRARVGDPSERGVVCAAISPGLARLGASSLVERLRIAV